MTNLKSLKKSIASTESLQSIVTTMKAHASTQIHQFERAAQASVSYRRVLDTALSILLADEEKKITNATDGDRTIHIIFGSDHGLAGNFNERMSFFASHHIPKDAHHDILVVGQQVYERLITDYTIKDRFSVPQTEDGIVPIVQRLLFKIDQLRDEAPVGKILLYYCRPLENAVLQEEIELLFPLDLEELAKNHDRRETKRIAIYLMDKETLLSNLLQQYFFLTLYRAFCYSLVSENTSRINSMNSAEKNIEERLNEFNFLYRMKRQTSITEEINDLLSGFRSLKKSKKNPSEE